MLASMWRFGVAALLALACAGVRAVDAEPMGTVIGIDLGTTYSCVGVYKGNRITPSHVAWDSNGGRLIGDAAKNQATMNPKATVFDVKRLIGRQSNDKSVQADMKLFPFKIIDKDNKSNVQVHPKEILHESLLSSDPVTLTPDLYIKKAQPTL